MFLLRACALFLINHAVIVHGTFSYEPEEAKKYASLSSVPYCDELGVVENWTCTPCNDSQIRLLPGKIKIIDDGWYNAVRTLVGRFEDGGGCLLSIRGTDNWINWLRDLQFWNQEPKNFDHCEGCKVHQGYYTIWQTMRDDIAEALNEIGCGNASNSSNFSVREHARDLYVTGHSLGAAVAHVGVFWLSEAGYTIKQMYTYESPRIGNKAFADAFDKRFSDMFPTFRITHFMDPIVHLPPLWLGYVQPNTEVYYDNNGQYKICNHTEDPSCSDQYTNVPLMIASHSSDHCVSPLVPNGNICFPPGCLNVNKKTDATALKSAGATTLVV
jgi:hypothetical protein